MLQQPITITYPIQPKRKSLLLTEVVDLFGLEEQEPPQTLVQDFFLSIQAGELILITGPSGCGKSSLLRALTQQLNATDLWTLTLPELPLIEALPGTVKERLDLLTGCGLAEPRLFLRLPSELSEGQRFRFRLALALAQTTTGWLAIDEFSATLDRTLAQVVSYNLRKSCTRTGVGMLLATTHEDVRENLDPDWWVQFTPSGQVFAHARTDTVKKKRLIDFFPQLWLSEGTLSDWAYFARWHYRSHHVGFVQKIFVLWHDTEPIGICVFCSAAPSIRLRNQYFALQASARDLHLANLNRKLWVLSRVVLHPTYRGAGIASAFIAAACNLCPVPWIETLSALGRLHPVFDRAGFQFLGVIRKRSNRPHSHRRYSEEYQQKSSYSEPGYWLRKNPS